MATYKINSSNINFPALVYFLSTLFMVFFSVNAIQKWPSLWAQIAISLACALPLLILEKKQHLIQGWFNKTWPMEMNLVLVIVTLGMLNIIFSEDRLASFKGMGLFLMSGILVLNTTYYLFKSRQVQKNFLYLCAFCFIILLAYGTFEFIQVFNDSKSRILLFSANPIAAGSLMILLSTGPFILLAETKNKRQRLFWIFCLLAGAALIILIHQISTVLTILLMTYFLIAKKLKIKWLLIIVVLVIMSIGFQFRDKILPQYKNLLLIDETVLVRMEFYHVAIDVIKEKPLFGLGFNSSLERFIPRNYVPKVYPRNREPSFQSMAHGLKVFDNMILSFFGETGGLFTISYVGLLTYLFYKLFLASMLNPTIKMQVDFFFLIMGGFMIHSMVFDSLKNPSLNWIFHSLLGLAANYRSSDQKTNEKEKIGHR